MRLLIVHGGTVFENIGGSEVQLNYIAGYLRKRGHDVPYYTMNYMPERSPQETVHGFTIYRNRTIPEASLTPKITARHVKRLLEVGALDGIYASNTYYLEKMRGWSGVLIEPVPHFYRECIRRRKKSKVFNCALVPNDYCQPTVQMVFAGCKSAISSDLESDGLEGYEFEAPARTLSSVLEEAGAPKIDFFSLDVEGYEIQVLNGLDMARFHPCWILVECLTPESKEQMRDFLAAHNYEFIAQVTPRDLLWRTKETC